jgi:hypothetical protein
LRVGKWHGTTKPGKCGFDRQFRIRLNDNRFYNATVLTNLEFDNTLLAVDWNKPPTTSAERHSLGTNYCPDVLNDIVNSYTAHHKAAGTKFFVYYPMVLAHQPLQPPPDQAHLTDPAAIYKSQVEHVDKLVGRVCDKAPNPIFLSTLP